MRSVKNASPKMLAERELWRQKIVAARRILPHDRAFG